MKSLTRALVMMGLSSAPKFDLYYAVSTNYGASFTETKIDHGTAPAFDLRLASGDGGRHEYNGIDLVTDGQNTVVWIAYTGTYSGDPGGDKTVMYVCEIGYLAQ